MLIRSILTAALLLFAGASHADVRDDIETLEFATETGARTGKALGKYLGSQMMLDNEIARVEGQVRQCGDCAKRQELLAYLAELYLTKDITYVLGTKGELGKLNDRLLGKEQYVPAACEPRMRDWGRCVDDRIDQRLADWLNDPGAEPLGMEFWHAVKDCNGLYRRYRQCFVDVEKTKIRRAERDRYVEDNPVPPLLLEQRVRPFSWTMADCPDCPNAEALKAVGEAISERGDQKILRCYYGPLAGDAKIETRIYWHREVPPEVRDMWRDPHQKPRRNPLLQLGEQALDSCPSRHADAAALGGSVQQSNRAVGSHKLRIAAERARIAAAKEGGITLKHVEKAAEMLCAEVVHREAFEACRTRYRFSFRHIDWDGTPDFKRMARRLEIDPDYDPEAPVDVASACMGASPEEQRFVCMKDCAGLSDRAAMRACAARFNPREAERQAAMKRERAIPRAERLARCDRIADDTAAAACRKTCSEPWTFRVTECVENHLRQYLAETFKRDCNGLPSERLTEICWLVPDFATGRPNRRIEDDSPRCAPTEPVQVARYDDNAITIGVPCGSQTLRYHCMADPRSGTRVQCRPLDKYLASLQAEEQEEEAEPVPMMHVEIDPEPKRPIRGDKIIVQVALDQPLGAARELVATYKDIEIFRVAEDGDLGITGFLGRIRLPESGVLRLAVEENGRPMEEFEQEITLRKPVVIKKKNPKRKLRKVKVRKQKRGKHDLQVIVRHPMYPDEFLHTMRVRNREGSASISLSYLMPHPWIRVTRQGPWEDYSVEVE